MAKKGGVQLLQADINTDDEFEKFLEKSGLLVMDVYTEWCGPCLAMVGSLKKIKLELGGDNLQLAICKSDTIEALKRFRNKSEPTWLFASNGKAINIMFGTNVPKLMRLITDELEIELAAREGKAERTFYEITDLLPLEIERINKAKEIEDTAVRIEREDAERKRKEYIVHVTDEIMRNLPDVGVTLFGPHVSREIFKKLIDPADSVHISCKDRKVIQLTPDMLQILFFEIDNPIEEDVLLQIYNKEMLICLWKLAENETKPIEDLLKQFVIVLTQPQLTVDEFGNTNPDLALPPIMQAMEITVKNGKKVDGTYGNDRNLSMKTSRSPSNRSLISGRNTPASEKSTKVDDTVSNAENVKKVLIPAAWTPHNKRANAAAIYLFFRQQTEFFLPPDPIPEPPHLAVAFDAYKRKDIVEICDQYKEDILSYGYFSSADPDAAKLIVNSTKKYDLLTPNVSDKLVLKVAKVTSHALLELCSQCPCYVSMNTVAGENECRKFFPEGYKTGEEEEEELIRQNLEAAAKKKKKRKSKKVEEGTESVGTVVSENDLEETQTDGDIDDDEDAEEGKEDEQNE